jgi:hypothetical protein
MVRKLILYVSSGPPFDFVRKINWFLITFFKFHE